MNGEKVREWAEELDRLAVECEHLHELLTAQLGLFWTGDAYEACLRESKDNKEVVQQAIQLTAQFAGGIKEVVPHIPSKRAVQEQYPVTDDGADASFQCKIGIPGRIVLHMNAQTSGRPNKRLLDCVKQSPLLR